MELSFTVTVQVTDAGSVSDPEDVADELYSALDVATTSLHLTELIDGVITVEVV